MSGVAGWVDLRRDLSQEWATVRSMTATMSCRGEAAEHVWTTPRAALGHRTHPATAGGHGQPLVEGEGEAGTRAAVVLDGEVFNAPELRAELAARGHRFRGSDTAEVVLGAYREWGAACAERFKGAYGIAVWDPREQTLVLIRDRLGNKPLFYFPTGDGVLFGSERKAILAHPLVEPVVDADGLREILSYAGTPGHGVFRGMHQVRPGHVVRFGPGGIREQRYWSLEAGVHEDDLDTTIQRIRALLEDAVRGQLAADTPLCMMLSGGLDSSGITALAARMRAERGEGALRTFTVSFAQDEDFQPDQVWNTEDSPYVHELVELVGAEHTDITIGVGDLLDPVVKANALRAKDVPSPLGNMNTSLYVLCRAIREHAPLALLGDAADGVFGGTMWMSIPQLLQAQTFPWLAMAHWAGGKHGMGTDLLDPGLLRELDVPGYAKDRYSDAMARVPHGPADTAEERRMREIWYLNVTNWLETLLPHGDSIAQSVGLEFRLPYCDHELVQYVFGAPLAMKTFDGREKSLLRAAVADLLPNSIVERQKSPYPVPQDPAYAKALCAELEGLLAEPNAPASPLLDADAARRFAADPDSLVSGPQAWVSRTHAEMALQLNQWLDEYRVRVDL
ncbi:asparagine synthase (glutamine-hydrolyzing) [Amycolatopsis aidingensis]|uniref:asparagine synthase (glutamine-hydrolyzing) n=1 Tax=Amycolatopsis aidingensis TaxID=2842453 RepID=UPI001C0AE201|nr:asparagine synthase (glutamine-hydrolyzing) [Amycolatopsis aidingensis]